MSDTSMCYKSCGDYIVTMKKLPDTITNESRKGIVNPLRAKFRANKLFVISIKHKETGKEIDCIQNTSYYYDKIWYKKSTEVASAYFCRDSDKVCAAGIHYFLSRDAAYYWDNKIIDGPCQSWHDNGQKYEEGTYINGKLHGTYQCFYDDGQIAEEHTYLAGILNGSYQTWHDNGQTMLKCNYINGSLNRSYQTWYKNGQIKKRCNYSAMSLNGRYQTWYKNGQKHVECTYVDGELHGLHQSCYSGGQTYVA